MNAGRTGPLLAAAALVVACGLTSAASTWPQRPGDITTPLVLDHNRLLVDAEIRAKDGTWHPARLWVDTGNPEFMLSEAFVRTLGFDIPSTSGTAEAPPTPISLPPVAVRLAGRPLNFEGVTPTVRVGARQWATMHADANVPSTVLRRYVVIVDYPGRRFHLRPADTATQRGVPVQARVHRQTGIPQVEALVAGERLSLALDIGASYSFVSAALVTRLARQHGEWPRTTGAVGCANIWGLWPEEERWPIARAPAIRLGAATIEGVGFAGLPDEMFGGSDLGTWYSQRTEAPVVGFLGPNAFKGFRLEIDYGRQTVYLERRGADDVHDMDIVGLTLQPAADNWRVLGSAVPGIEPGDLLIQVGDLRTQGATMGTVVDALRGAPGDTRVLTAERQGRRVRVQARVRRCM